MPRAGISSANGVRRRNLGRVLRLIHHGGPLSRARLTTLTGLNRSTVAALVADLAANGLVLELAPDPTNRVGRPSPMAAPAPGVVAIAANPEVDAVTVAAVRLGGGMVQMERTALDRPPTPGEACDVITRTIDRWREGALARVRLTSIGIAVPGLVRAADGLVRWAPHLAWFDVDLRTAIEAATGLAVVIANDASAGALAEQLFGAGRAAVDIVYLNGGPSGIGGGLIVNGSPVTGAGGYAGEFGQNRPGITDPADRMAPAGVLEDEVSRARLLAAVGLTNADEPTLAAALHASADPAVAREIDRQRRILATALANAINVLNPAMVILGGFLATLCGVDTEELRGAVAAQSIPAAYLATDIRVAQLGEARLMIGAAELAFGPLLDDPLG